MLSFGSAVVIVGGTKLFFGGALIVERFRDYSATLQDDSNTLTKIYEQLPNFECTPEQSLVHDELDMI